jgi:anti-sigma-K factor RskA
MNNQPALSSVDQPPSLVRVASDELLLLGARLHDDVALGVLFDRYGPEVYALALDTVQHGDAAEAVMQDVFLRCWRGVEIYDTSRGTTHDWLLEITRSRALDAVAKLEPFGGAPDFGLRHNDTGLLGSAEPASGARDRLLSRARAEGGSARAAEAPTVVIPLAELGSETAVDPEAPTLTDLPILGPDVASDGPVTARDGQPPVVEIAPTEHLPVSDNQAPPDADTELAEAVTAPATIDPAWAPDTQTDAHEVVQDEHAAPDAVTIEAEQVAPVTAEAVAIEAEQIEPVTAEARTVAAVGPDQTPTEAITVEVDQIESPPSVDAAASADADVLPDADDDAEADSAEVERKPGEVPTSEALAAALAPIQPRRQQPHRPAPDAPSPRRIKMASIFWAGALLFVIASRLIVTAWSATGPHLSPDLAVMSRLPGGRVITLRAAGTPTASVRLHSIDSGRRAELSADGLAPLPNGRVYQLWIVEPNQQPRSAGAFFVNRRGDAVAPMILGGPVERLQGIFLTQEPAPGTTTPTGPRLLEGAP